MTNLDGVTNFKQAAVVSQITTALWYALFYQQHYHWKVFPAPPGTKKSYKSMAFSDGRRWGATDDLKEIRRDFNNPKWLDAGIGVPTGPINGFFAIEADTVKGHPGLAHDGDIELQKLIEQAQSSLPETLMAESPTGSRRYLLRYPSPEQMKALEIDQIGGDPLAPGVDVIGDGDMIIMPPSVHALGGRYVWINPEHEIAEAPLWLLRKVGRKVKARSDQQAQTEEVDIRLVAAAVAAIPNNDIHYDEWYRHLLVIKWSTGGSEQGFAIFDTHSRKSAKYNELNTRELWDKAKPDGRVRWATLSWLAAQHDQNYEAVLDFDGKAADGGQPASDTGEQYTNKSSPRTEMLTDLGNARRLVRLYGQDLRYVHAWKSWLVWRDDHWHRDENGAVMRTAKTAVEEMFTEASRIKDEAGRAAMRKYALQSQSAQRLMAMVKLAESETEVVVAVEQFDADPYLLGVRNGVVELRTGTFRKARRDDYVTKLAAVAFDPQAQCPNWTSFLKKIFTNDELIKYLQRSTGYLLTGLTVEEVMFVFYGLGANGKSTFRETIFALLGDYAVGSDASLLISHRRAGEATPDLARLLGRRLVTVNETKANDRLNESGVKFITGHDIITARKLYEDLFDFTPTHKTILTTNHKPIITGADEGIWRRLHLVPFITTIAKSNRDLHFRRKVLLPELSGILNWALDGLKVYWQEGLHPPAVVMDATKEYRDDMDLIGNWIEERCELDGNAKIRTAVLCNDYQVWAQSEVGFTMSPIAFGRELVSRGFASVKAKGGGRGILGLKLRSIPTGDEECGHF